MKAYKIISLVAVALSLASCEDFLDKQPDENLTLDDVFANRLYTRDFLTHTYSWIPTEANMADDGGAWRNPFTAGSDEMECAFGGAYAHQINNGGWNPTDIKRTQVWQESYMALRKVNMIIERVDECPAADDEKRRWKGEAYFLRAYYHFLAFRAYGPIIIADHSFKTDENILALRRAPVDQVVDFIVKDCNTAQNCYMIEMSGLQQILAVLHVSLLLRLNPEHCFILHRRSIMAAHCLQTSKTRLMVRI